MSPSPAELGEMVAAASQFLFYVREVGTRTPEGRLTKVIADGMAFGAGGRAFAKLYYHPIIAGDPARPSRLRVAGWPEPLSEMLLYVIPRLRDITAAIAQQGNVRLGPDPFGIFGEQSLSWLLKPGEPMTSPEFAERLERATNTLASILAQLPTLTADTPAAPEEPGASEAGKADGGKQAVNRGKQIEARDKWVYDECCKGTAYDSIARNLPKRNPKWPRISTKQGILACAKRYAKRHELPDPPPRQER